MHIRIPLNALGLNSNSINIQIKWADNLQNPGVIYDFYLNGDVVPNGRFNYQFIVRLRVRSQTQGVFNYGYYKDYIIVIKHT